MSDSATVCAGRFGTSFANATLTSGDNSVFTETNVELYVPVATGVRPYRVWARRGRH